MPAAAEARRASGTFRASARRSSPPSTCDQPLRPAATIPLVLALVSAGPMSHSCQRIGSGVRTEKTFIGKSPVGVLNDHLARLIRRREGAGDGDCALSRFPGLAWCRLAFLADAPLAVRHWANAINMSTQHRLLRTNLCNSRIRVPERYYPCGCSFAGRRNRKVDGGRERDRKSTRLNSS